MRGAVTQCNALGTLVLQRAMQFVMIPGVRQALPQLLACQRKQLPRQLQGLLMRAPGLHPALRAGQAGAGVLQWVAVESPFSA